MTRNKILAMFVMPVILSVLAAGYLGVQVGKTWENNNIIGFAATGMASKAADLWEIPRAQKFFLAMREVAGLENFYSDYGQDKWIIRSVFPNVRNGYYVDLGSADGVRSSNTKALDDLGWEGLCIDPFPTNMTLRRCKECREVVSSVSGEKVAFRTGGFLGGIVGYFGATMDWPGVKETPTVEFTTVTLDDVLTRANAPSFIHYMSIDIEGAELEALRGFSFSKYKVGAFTIEHNHEEPKRSQIRSLLESNGYRFVLGLIRDDCYVAESLIEKQKIN